MGIVAWLIPNWKSFHYITSIPIFASLLIYFVIPESPRWLITKQRYKELDILVRKIARRNKMQVSEDIQSSLAEAVMHEPENEYCICGACGSFNCINKDAKGKRKDNGIAQLFSNPLLRTNTLVMFANWAIVTLGLSIFVVFV